MTMHIEKEKTLLNKRKDAVEEQEELYQKQVEKNRVHPESSYTPHLFNFDHYYDPELTPRKPWQ